MYLKIFNCLKKTYIIFLISVLFIIFTTTDLKSSIFKVNDIEISEPFETNFKKEKVADKAFREAFKRLIKMTIPSNEAVKLKNIKNSEIKNLIDSFNIKNEKFVKNSYTADFDVSFNKQNTLLFFEKKNIFPSIPKKKKILILPILIDNQNKTINLYNQNPFFDNWIVKSDNVFLLDYILPSEDLDLIRLLNKNIETLENFNFENVIKGYDIYDFITCLIYKDGNLVKVLSKININNNNKIISNSYENIDLKNEKQLMSLIIKIKDNYEDIWKKLNQINRSVKLPLNISVNAENLQKNIEFENFLNDTEFVSNFFIKDFNNERINYKIIFNGSPKKFLDLSSKKGIQIDTSTQVWYLK